MATAQNQSTAEQKPPVEATPNQRASAAPNPSKFARTKAALDAQPKVPIMLEIRKGEPSSIVFSVNGVSYTVERGKTVEVPKQIAEMVFDRLKSENALTAKSDEFATKTDELKIKA